jgi:hypothetical protein
MAQARLLIRDDGMLCPFTKGAAMRPNMRPYHGDPKANKEDRLKWLAGTYGSTAVTSIELQEAGSFDIGKANKGELLEFASNEYGVDLDSRKSEDQLRKEIVELASK